MRSAVLASTSSNSISDNGYYTWDEAMRRFGSGITIGGERYRLPTKEELGELAGSCRH